MEGHIRVKDRKQRLENRGRSRTIQWRVRAIRLLMNVSGPGWMVTGQTSNMFIKGLFVVWSQLFTSCCSVWGFKSPNIWAFSFPDAGERVGDSDCAPASIISLLLSFAITQVTQGAESRDRSCTSSASAVAPHLSWSTGNVHVPLLWLKYSCWSETQNNQQICSCFIHAFIVRECRCI